MGEARAYEVSRSAGRSWVFNEDDEEASKVVEKEINGEASKVAEKEKNGEASKDGEKEKNGDASTVVPNDNRLLKYFCISETDETIFTGTIVRFNAEYLYATIKPDGESESEIFCDASSIKKEGSYMAVCRGVKVDFRKGTNAAGTVVATCCTGPGGKAIDNKALRSLIAQKRRLVKAITIAKKRKKRDPISCKPDIILPPAPVIPSGKSPVSVIYQFAVSCKPKKVVAFKQIGEDFRVHCENGVRNAYTYECRIDGEFIAKGTARTKKSCEDLCRTVRY